MNRVAIFVFYDKDGIVDRYVIYLLQEILKVVNRLVIVCNGKLSVEGREAFSMLTPDILERKNEGFDAWAFKTGLEYLGWGDLAQYDELILLNDTVYGPLYPFKIMFDEMAKKNLDFWGITKHGECADPYGVTQSGILPEHIQSYFFAINRKMFLYPEFKSYWSNLPNLYTRKETICFFELRFTKYFSDLGFTWDVYINTDAEFKEFTDVSLLERMPYELIKNYRAPVIKRRNFSEKYSTSFRYTVGDSTKKVFDYIKGYTEYDADLIWENILRTMDFKNVKDNLHLNYILPQKYVSGKTINIANVKVALFAHIYYEDQIEYCANYAASIIDNADIIVTTHSEHMKNVIIKRFGKINCRKLEVIVLHQNRGRDVSALWVALKPYIVDYDYICFIHDKKSPQDKPLTIGRDFAYKCLENTLASKEYVLNILSTFHDNPRLGMLFPPPPMHGPYRAIISSLWCTNYRNTTDLARKLNINVPMDEQGLVFPAGCIFWFRTKALKKLIDQNWDYSDFHVEPMPIDGTFSHALERIYCFAAQSEGYYSAWVMTEQFAAAELTSLNYLLIDTHIKLNQPVTTDKQIHLKDCIKHKLKKYPKVFNAAQKIYSFLVERK
ncbi:MAG: rhamnan synthesis F family protein [Spirochaetaceae bacterium]|nr:rhamnan synthesis F family protein [Spirochaetaceae bacterium]